MHPGGSARGTSSTLNLTSSADRSHQVVVGVGTGKPVVLIVGGSTHLVVDLIGYVVIPRTAH